MIQKECLNSLEIMVTIMLKFWHDYLGFAKSGSTRLTNIVIIYKKVVFVDLWINLPIMP